MWNKHSTPVVIVSTEAKAGAGQPVTFFLAGQTRTREKREKVTAFPPFSVKSTANRENSRFQSGNKQEKIYRKIMKKLLQFVKDRVTL